MDQELITALKRAHLHPLQASQKEIGTQEGRT